MLLTEVKKLKVAELRAMLTERGLDPKGLKAELVGRLISAIEAGVEPISSVEEEENVSEPMDQASRTDIQEPHLTESEQCVRDQSLVCTTPSKTIHTYTDQSTQTDPQQLCSCTATRDTAEQLTSQTRQVFISSSQQQRNPLQSAATEDPVALATPSTEEEDAMSGCSSSVCVITDARQEQDQLIHRQSDGLETAGALEESRETRRPQEERGRDYYEFKEDIHYIRAKAPEPVPDAEDEIAVDFEDVRLDSYNCDLHFEVGSNGSSGQPRFWEKFPLLWSGCRMTHGFCQGRVGFEAKFLKRLSSSPLDTSHDSDLHVLRVGWSVDNTSLQLGEVEMSYGFDGRGKIVVAGKEEEFGEPFSEGDVIGCFAFINEKGEATLSFHKNGRSLGVAFHLSASALGGQALFPHVLCKNCSVLINLDPETPWYSFPAGFCTLHVFPPGQRIRASLPTPSKRDCEVLMMVGMPGSGKTHWAQAHMAQNPRKRYNLLSTNSILECMREPPGIKNKELMLQQATQCVSQLITIAATKRRNYILDQANIYPSTQRHKMLCFHGYQRKAVVVFPPDEMWRRRLVQRQEDEGMAIPEMSLLKAKVSFTLPEVGEHLDEVLFVELCADEALKLLTQYKEAARRLLPTPPKRKKHRHGNQKRTISQSRVGCDWRRGPFYCQSHNQRLHCCPLKTHGRYLSSNGQSYGCSSDPQRYRKYYRPCTGQWNLSDQSQNYDDNNYGCSA